MTRRNLVKILLVTSILSIAAWTLPEEKGGAIAGRWNYSQFAFALLATSIFLSFTFLAFTSEDRRRQTTFRILAVWLGISISISLFETWSFLWPARHLMDNPWYLALGEGLQKEDEDLRFTRAPYLRWTGLSRGDLAMRNGDPDPYARRVTFSTDFEGFRNSRDLEEADLIFLGDSFTEAGNIPEEETFVFRIAANLGLEARNLGRAGYSSPSELVVLKKYGLKNRPRLVFWQVAESNDLHGAAKYQEWIEEGKRNFKREKRGQPTRIESWKRRSPTYRLFDIFRDPSPWSLSGIFRDEENKPIEVRFLPRLPGPYHQPIGHPGWTIMVSSIQEGASLLEEQGIALIVFLIPMKLRVMGARTYFHNSEIETLGSTRKIEGRLPPDWDLKPESTLSHHLKKLCERLNITFVDTTEHLQEKSGKGQILYLPMDTHLSSLGHRAISDLLIDHVRASPRYDLSRQNHD